MIRADQWLLLIKIAQSAGDPQPVPAKDQTPAAQPAKPVADGQAEANTAGSVEQQSQQPQTQQPQTQQPQTQQPQTQQPQTQQPKTLITFDGPYARYRPRPVVPDTAIPLEKLYEAVILAETGSVPNPWIRTHGVPGTSSSAFGPAQLTVSTWRDFSDRYGLDERYPFFDRIFTHQGKQFLTYGREPNKEGYNKIYDYGGTGMGLWRNPASHPIYHEPVKDLFSRMYAEKKFELMPTLERYRGVPYDKDRRYFDTILKHLGIQK